MWFGGCPRKKRERTSCACNLVFVFLCEISPPPHLLACRCSFAAFLIPPSAERGLIESSIPCIDDAYVKGVASIFKFDHALLTITHSSLHVYLSQMMTIAICRVRIRANTGTGEGTGRCSSHFPILQHDTGTQDVR